ncbi:MAG: PEP/pyruvate-binding domain-containing protein [bacterium]
MKEKKRDSLPPFNPYWLEHGYGTRLQVFQNLMPFRIRNILLVSSLYDLFLFEEDGRLYELLREEYKGLNLTHTPELTRVSSGKDAITLAKSRRQFDLIICTLHIEDMPVHRLAKKARDAGLTIPIVLLAYDNRELSELALYHDMSVFDQVFVWQGDFRIMIAIIKYLEDKRNVEQDTDMVGVQSIILIEDRVRYYSSFLPIIYVELFKQARRLISEGISLSHKFLRMRARPKILLCTNYEEAWQYFKKYQDHILGIISDINYKRKGKYDPQAGLKFARNVKRHQFDIPILLQSSHPENEQKANAVGAAFLLKGSSTLLQDLRKFMDENFGFGDFVFRTGDGVEVGRATDLKSLEHQLHAVPDESIVYHSNHNHFSKWLKARTEFWLAHKLRPRHLSEFESVQGLREMLISSLQEYRRNRQRGIITDFDRDTFYPHSSFARIGGGSLGGKARGLSFVNRLVYNYKVNESYDRVNVSVPPAVVLGTEVFDRFLDENDLHQFALTCEDDRELNRRFLEVQNFPLDALHKLREFIEMIEVPLAVRSSSLLEDSQYYPFAGVYDTFMLPNNHENLNVRLFELLSAIKRVYASTFSQDAKSYFKITDYRLEEEKMAVVIQEMVGGPHGDYFYPDFAGVAKSYNFYPVAPQVSKDGLVSVALGLGKTVVDGGVCVKFCPRYPQLLPQFNSIRETLNNNQQQFYALNLNGHVANLNEMQDTLLQRLDLETAEQDGTLKYAGSTYCHENEAIYDGISRPGQRLVTFAPVLKYQVFPLAEILEHLLEIGVWAMGTPIEIEFAVRMSVPKNEPMEFAILQMRPLVIRHEFDTLEIEETETEKLICRSSNVLGNGLIDDIRDIVMVGPEGFDRQRSHEAASELTSLNQALMTQNRPYLLVGVGRWGSLDPLLGIPVKWEQISGARVIVESGFDDIEVTPSQGSHFFHNLTSFRVGYFTVTSRMPEGHIDWSWLYAQQACKRLKFTRHLRFELPLTVKMNGRKNRGIILKPEA